MHSTTTLQPTFTNMPVKFEELSPTQTVPEYVFPDTETYDTELYMDGYKGCLSSSSPPQYQLMSFIPECTDVYPSPEQDAESPLADVLPQEFQRLEDLQQLENQARLQQQQQQQPHHQQQQQQQQQPSGGVSGGVPCDAPTPAKAPVKRKRENRYKNAPPSVLSRRRAQNRASQRAYRERKDQRIKDLEKMLDEAKRHADTLGQAYTSLQIAFRKLESHFPCPPGPASQRDSISTVSTVSSNVPPPQAPTQMDQFYIWETPMNTSYAM